MSTEHPQSLPNHPPRGDESTPMAPNTPSQKPLRLPWKRRPIFLWQLRTVLTIIFIYFLLHLPSFLTSLHPYVSSTHQSITSSTPPNPCLGRPKPPSLRAPTPTVFFVHIPKTAGTLLFRLLLLYASRTHGIACQYVSDGNRLPTHDFRQFGGDVFPEGTDESRLSHALNKSDIAEKARLFSRGVCRVVRGHVTYAQHDAITAPTLSVTVMRQPLARFVSMYEFVKSMVRDRPGMTGWDNWVTAHSLAAEFANSSSLFHRAFYDDTGHWLAAGNVGFSFHFYGVLHQLSGVIPRFEGVGDPYHFNITNAAEMADRAMDNLCKTHVLGLQEDMPGTLATWFDEIEPWVNFTKEERERFGGLSLNRTPGRVSRNVDDHLPLRIRQELERRLEHEIRVYDFAKRLVEYRSAVAALKRGEPLKTR